MSRSASPQGSPDDFPNEEAGTRTDLARPSRRERSPSSRPSGFHPRGALVDEVLAPRVRDARFEEAQPEGRAEGEKPLEAAPASSKRASGIEWWNGREWVPQEQE